MRSPPRHPFPAQVRLVAREHSLDEALPLPLALHVRAAPKSPEQGVNVVELKQ